MELSLTAPSERRTLMSTYQLRLEEARRRKEVVVEDKLWAPFEATAAGMLKTRAFSPERRRYAEDQDEVTRALSPGKRVQMANTGPNPIGYVPSDVREGLGHALWLPRWRAVQALRVSTQRDDVQAILSLLARSRDENREVSVVALEALGELCSRGNELVAMSVVELLESGGRGGDRDWDPMREAAVGCLARVGVPGDFVVCNTVLGLLTKDPAVGVRLAALGAVIVLGIPRDEQTVAACVLALEDEDEGIREGAVGALRALSERGDVDVVQGLENMCKNDESIALRRLAAASLSSWAALKDDKDTCTLLVRQLDNADREIKRTSTIGVLARLRSKDRAVRDTALKALTRELTSTQARTLSPTKGRGESMLRLTY